MKAFLVQSFRDLDRGWDRFWFESEEPQAFALYRSVLAALLFAFYAICSLDLKLFYSEGGFLSLSAIQDTMPMQYRLSVFRAFTSDTALVIGNLVFLGSLLAMVLGQFTRVAAAIALIFHLSFLHRNMAVIYGIDLIASCLLFYLAIAVTAEMRSVARRLTQLQICVVYGYSGWEKLKGASWWSGEALWGVLANSQIARFDFTFLSHFPILIVIGSTLTLVWEIYFPALVWFSRWRKPILAFGVLFHIGIALTIHITFFAGIMIVAYIAFLSDQDVIALKRWAGARFQNYGFGKKSS